MTLQCPSQSHDGATKIEKNAHTKMSEKASQMVFWEESFCYIPSLYGVEESCYIAQSSDGKHVAAMAPTSSSSSV
jgi:hypothetical protein